MTRQELESYLQQCVLGWCRVSAQRMCDDGVDEEQIRNLLNASMPELVQWHNDMLTLYDCDALSSRWQRQARQS
jgi:hypothetical protein